MSTLSFFSLSHFWCEDQFITIAQHYSLWCLCLYIFLWLDVFVNATSFYLKHIFGAIYCVHRVDYVWMNIWADRFVNNIFVFRYEIEDYYKLEILTCCWASDVSFPESFTTIGELKWKTNNINKELNKELNIIVSSKYLGGIYRLVSTLESLEW